MSQVEIQQLEVAVMTLAKAIEAGRIDGVLEDVKTIMGYLPQ
jgi:hypothetical protein